MSNVEIGRAGYFNDGETTIWTKSPWVVECIKNEMANKAISLIKDHRYVEAVETVEFLVDLDQAYNQMIQAKEKEESDE